MRSSGLPFAGPASLTWHALVAQPRSDPFALCVDAVLGVVALFYLSGLRRDGARDRSAQWAAASFFLGLLLLYVAIGSGYAGAQYLLPSVDVGQHVVLMMVAPPLLALGRPGRVVPRRRQRDAPAKAARRARATGAARPPGFLSSAGRAASGVGSWPLYYGSMAAYFLTSAYAASLRDPALLDVTQVGFVAVGLLFWVGLVGAGPEGTRRSFTFRLVAVIAGMPVETAVGLSLALWPRPLAAGETLASTHAAGLLLWLASMFTSGVALAVLLVQWCIADARRGNAREGFVLPIPTPSDGGAASSRP